MNTSTTCKTESELYENLVRAMIKTGDDKPVSNGKPEHAAIIYKLFFEFAVSKVLIFCKELNSSVFGDDRILMMAEKALERGVTIRVITQGLQPQPSNFTKWLLEKAKSGSCVSVKTCKVGSPYASLPMNFALMDEKAYRYEANNDHVKAVACMNNPRITTELANFFDTINTAVAA